MRIRPDGRELLASAREVIDVAIVPHLADERRAVLDAIGRAIALAEDRLTRDAQASAADLAELEEARVAMRGEVLRSLPEERRYDARLVAKAISIAALQLATAQIADRREYDDLAALLDEPADPNASPNDIRCQLPALNERLVARIRAGEADPGTVMHAATLAYLEATTHEALSETNPMHRQRPSAFIPSPARATTASTSRVDTSLTARGDAPRPVWQARSNGAAQSLARIDGWLKLYGLVGEAVYASSNAALTAQADLVGWFTQRLAANPRVPMAAVEGAHQAHDLSLAVADASAAFFKLALAPFRRIEPRPADATRLP